MRLVTFTHERCKRIGAVKADQIIDLGANAPTLPLDMKSFLRAGEDAWEEARVVTARTNSGIPLNEVRIEAPIHNPDKILAIGLNYADHVAESNLEMPAHQMWFNKQSNTVAGPHDPILIPAAAPDYVDYEAEMVMIIGRHCRHVPRERAPEVIFGYTCGNDVSVRDWQLRTTQYTLGKSFATHAALGPWIVTADEFGNPHNKALTGHVNDELRQSSNTSQLIFDCFDQIAELTTAFALEPGDVIFTGTPSGVGAAMKPRRFIAAQDRVRIEIDDIGTLESRFENETAATLIR